MLKKYLPADPDTGLVRVGSACGGRSLTTGALSVDEPAVGSSGNGMEAAAHSRAVLASLASAVAFSSSCVQNRTMNIERACKKINF